MQNLEANRVHYGELENRKQNAGLIVQREAVGGPVHSFLGFQKVSPFISLSLTYLCHSLFHSKPQLLVTSQLKGFHSSYGWSRTCRLLWSLLSPGCPYKNDQADWNINLLYLQKNNVREVMCSIPVVPRSCYVDQFTFHKKIIYEIRLLALFSSRTSKYH